MPDLPPLACTDAPPTRMRVDTPEAIRALDDDLQRLWVAAQRDVPMLALTAQARQLGRRADALHISDGMLGRLLKQTLAGSRRVDAFTIATVIAAAINARRGLTL